MTNGDDPSVWFGRIWDLMVKFNESPKHVVVFLQEEDVGEDIKSFVRDQLNWICFENRLGQFIDTVDEVGARFYIFALAREFAREPTSVEEFLELHHVPNNLRGRLSKVLETLQKSEAGRRILLGVAFNPADNT